MAAENNRDRLEQIADALGISTDVLLASAGRPCSPARIEGCDAVLDLHAIREIIECFAKIEDSAGRARLLAYARDLATLK